LAGLGKSSRKSCDFVVGEGGRTQESVENSGNCGELRKLKKWLAQQPGLEMLCGRE